jgi:hypothetical protein
MQGWATVKLAELEPQLYRYAGEKTFTPVETVAEADSVMFLCPACFLANAGAVGTHSVRVDFAGKAVPAEVAIRNGQGQPVWWNASGNDVSDLTLSPSILLLHDCKWHGFVTNGEIR